MGEPSSPAEPGESRAAEVPASPLDPFVNTFVAWLAAQERGVNINRLGTEVAEATGWYPAFAEAVVSAARARGLLAPVFGRGRRTRNVGLSRRARELLEQ